jgi:YD repeat-containing protein
MGVQRVLAAPTVAITSPANNAQYQAPASLSLTASANDSSSPIARVSYYIGTTLIGTSTQAPYTVSWSNVAAGSYSLKATATNNAGDVGTSLPIDIQVNTSPGINGSVQHTYDAAGRLVATIASDGSGSQYGYDTVGNIVSVTKTAAAPVWISQFSPDEGASGSQVVLSGGGFSLNSSDNVVKFNGLQATVSMSTATSLTVTVPTGATTGKVSISNQNGAATSVADFIVPTLSPNGVPVSVNIPANGTFIYRFVGNVSDAMSLLMRNVSTSPASTTVTASVARPDGSNLVNCSTSAIKSSCLLPYLPMAGTYVITLSAGTSSATLNLCLIADVRPGALAINGTLVSAAIPNYGQAATYSFTGNAGQDITAGVWNDAIPGITGVYVYKPDGTVWASTNVYYGSGVPVGDISINGSLPMTGTYLMRVVPINGATGNISALVAQNASGSIAIDGASTAVNLNFQRGLYTFNGAAGQMLGLGVTGLKTVPLVEVYRFPCSSLMGRH